MKRSCREVKALQFSLAEWPVNPDAIGYAIVDFQEYTISEENKLVPGMPPTCVLIPFVKQRCEKKWWSTRTLPLRVCKATSTHKSQGITVGPEQLLENVVLELPASGQRTTPELELVAESRSKGPENFAIGNELSLLDKNICKKLGKHQHIYHTDSFKKSSEQQWHSLSKELETGSIN